MKLLISSFIILFFISCISSKSTAFIEVKCDKEEVPAFDGPIVSILDKNGKAIKDTILRKIEKRRTVFKPFRDYIYLANFYDKDKNLITSSEIKMTGFSR